MKTWSEGADTAAGHWDRKEGPMNATSQNEGLSLWYRFGWRVRYILVNIFGPAQLADHDPSAELRRERQAKVEQARRSRS
jgi:hypothetical protein